MALAAAPDPISGLYHDTVDRDTVRDSLVERSPPSTSFLPSERSKTAVGGVRPILWLVLDHSLLLLPIVSSPCFLNEAC